MLKFHLNFYRNLKSCKERKPDLKNFAYDPSVDLNNLTTHECNCDIGTQQCPADASGTPPPRIQMSSYDILYNLTGRNISDYLLKTREDFYKKRYGGFEFGVRNPLSNRNLSQLREITDRWLKATNLGEPRIDDTVRDLIFGNIEDFALSSGLLDSIRVWFNNKGWAASVAYMNAVNNIVLRASIEAQQEDFDSFDWDNSGFKDSSKFGMAVVNHPMNYTKEQLDTEVM